MSAELPLFTWLLLVALLVLRRVTWGRPARASHRSASTSRAAGCWRAPAVRVDAAAHGRQGRQASPGRGGAPPPDARPRPAKLPHPVTPVRGPAAATGVFEGWAPVAAASTTTST